MGCSLPRQGSPVVTFYPHIAYSPDDSIKVPPSTVPLIMASPPTSKPQLRPHCYFKARGFTCSHRLSIHLF